MSIQAAKSISKEQEQAYVDSQGVHCPVCESRDIEGGSHEFEGNIVLLSVCCLECRLNWTDIYKLSGIYQD